MEVAPAGLGVGRTLAPVGKDVRPQEFARASDGVAGLEGIAQAEAGNLPVRGRRCVKAVGEVDFFEDRAGDGPLTLWHIADLPVSSRHQAILEEGADAVSKTINSPFGGGEIPGASGQAFEIEARLGNDLGGSAVAVDAF